MEGGTSVRAIAFCLARLGSNPGTDLGFFQFRIAVNLFSLRVGLFSNNVSWNSAYSFFFFLVSYYCLPL